MARPRSYLIAPYAFKGVLSAADAADAIAVAMTADDPTAECVRLPLGDGGGGTLDALLAGVGGNVIRAECMQATGAIAASRWGMLRDGTAVIEAAECIALADVPAALRSPGTLTTRGIGQLIREAIAKRSDSLCIGLGDTATHDCGLGMASALGYRFLGARGDQLEPIGRSLPQLASIDADYVIPLVRHLQCVALCDVMNPLVGPDGAALRFAAQKGADAAAVELLEEGSRRFADVVRRELGVSVDTVPGAGSAGGLGAGLHLFLGARLTSGAEAVLDAVSFDNRLNECGGVITAEGRVDHKTLLGKGTSHVAERARTAGIPCVIVTGGIEGERSELEAALGATIIVLADADPSAGATRESIHRAAFTIRGAIERTGERQGPATGDHSPS